MWLFCVICREVLGVFKTLFHPVYFIIYLSAESDILLRGIASTHGAKGRWIDSSL